MARGAKGNEIAWAVGATFGTAHDMVYIEDDMVPADGYCAPIAFFM